jgi:glucosylceramidase
MNKQSFAILALSVLSATTFAQQKKSTYDGRNITVYTTAENTELKLSKSGNATFGPSKQPLETEICVFVEPKNTFQSLLGIGGAITDASAEVFAGLSTQKQKELIDAYYNKDTGIGYSLMRTNIHSCDFSSESYTYIKEGDKELKTFNIDHDKKFRIPLIKRANAAAGGKMTLFVTPWSPPAFMKDNNDMLKGGKLLPEFSQAWANYYVKYIKALEKEGIPVWGMTLQNEPMATQKWESCIFTAEDERDFLKNYLGPTIKKELSDKKIIVWDHNRDLMNQRANVIFSDPEAAKYAWGLGYHWYETWAGGEPMFGNEQKVHEAFPDKNLIFTEGCIEKFDETHYQYWPNGERYGRSMINDFNNGTVGWTDWNILLDDKGGPNHVENYCQAPVHVVKGEIIYTPSYYYIGHFSKFIRPDAKRISTAVSRSTLLSTSFINPDGKIATVVMNQTDKPVTYSVFVDNAKTTLDIPAHAIQTLVY